MNVWNLIDGMDGLASGVGAIVCATLAVAAATMGHLEVAYVGAGLAGALCGFLVFNFHPAKIFLGDTGSLLLGAMLGMLAIRGSLKSGMTVAILIPVLAMGLPIVDTLLAILRRWVRHLPWNSPDRGHLHHRLIAFGLSTRQASAFLYSFTILLCGAALSSVALQSDMLAVIFAILGTLGLGAVFAARRDERVNMLSDFRQRITIRRLEQRLARHAWEAIQRLTNATTLPRVESVVEDLAEKLACDHFRLRYQREGVLVLERRGAPGEPAVDVEPSSDSDLEERSSLRQRVQLRFAVADWPGEELVLELQQRENDALPLALGGHFLQRLARELLFRCRQIHAEEVRENGSRARVPAAAIETEGWAPR
jgi:UDP-GlcNAc:undecaprenyl-phosphate GlcNAc-1-phosphate transferase